ncbi:MAG: hypothetical protein AB8B72_13955 [Crocinitomicaceae bacterium]
MQDKHKINKWSFTIIAALHILVWAAEFNFINPSYGRALAMFTLIGQALLGVIQLIIAIPMLTSLKAYSTKIKKLIKTYWTLVALYILTSTISIANTLDVFEPLILFTPMAIAGYFVWVTYKASSTNMIPNAKSNNIGNH